ncbi:M6 family metalloprotease domain-containing protein [Bacillus mycoides]|uniref:M6 family metalloprotease domain-containing protein n=1 Tax=Bacillus cereus VD021 TaxID=1053224 RepID=R8HFX0_BACCE|nr:MULTISPECIES: M6 family metalloprotease domain-containing protein [Bacillus cereus group]EOO71769.1 M6 family metalloprotease domain-containing protein [Bacillus cereus VD021]MCQ6568886.1 M6 family metalloprotease domain-containing protein [Bacillus mycoides]
MSAIVGEILTFPHGEEKIKLRVFGDEFYARYESIDGYTAIYDSELGKYCFADLENGRFVSSGKDITGIVPKGITRHLKEDSSEKTKKFSKRYNEIRPNITDPNIEMHESKYDSLHDIDNNEDMKTRGPSNGLLDNMSLTNGDVLGLTVLVEFADKFSSVTLRDVDEMLNSENYHKNGNFCSVNEYFKTISSGKLNYRNKVVGPIKLSKGIEYYKNTLFVEEAMDILVNDLNVDLSQFDSKQRGIVDAINFLYAGETLYEKNLWPHNSIINLEYNSVKTHFYLLTSLGRNSGDLSIGTFCHETGHLLCRFPDMYDYGDPDREDDKQKSQGIGAYCLMGSGNHLNNGLTPSPVCAYLRDLAGWCENNIILTDGVYTARHGDYNTVIRYNTDKTNEYFLVENRTALALDRYLPSSGLAIYHCDINGSNEYQDGTPSRHYQCALLQADGNLDLENNRNNGDSKDLFKEVTGIAISGNTTPSSKQWDGVDSGLTILDITVPGENIEFKVQIRQ